MNTGQIIIYQTPEGATAIDVKLDKQTLWINRLQMAELFDRDIKTIGKHINNALKEELSEMPVVAKFATTASDGKVYQVDHYNIEMITSVGYRVKSKRGTQFRIWANNVLKDYLIKGYAVKENIKLEQYEQLKQTIKVISNVLENRDLDCDQTSGLLRVVSDYAYALDTLDKYDYQKLTIERTTHSEQFIATYENAMEAIGDLRAKFGGSTLFGNEKDQSFKSSIGAIYQTFAGQELYSSVEQKAAMLLYLVTKTTPLATVTNVLPPFYFCGLWNKTAFCTPQMATNA